MCVSFMYVVSYSKLFIPFFLHKYPFANESSSLLVSMHSNIFLRLYIMSNTDKKEKKIFLIYKEIQKGAVAKSYMRMGFLIYEKMRKYFVIQYMRSPLVIYDFATAPF
jgi:hypothetical protein